MSGMKFDTGKLAYHLVDEDAEAEMVAVLTFGATKYDPGNWSKVEDAVDRYYSAARRHLRASRKGEVLDPETQLATLASAACCIHFLLALEMRRHPELAASLPERLEKALGTARRIRTEREGTKMFLDGRRQDERAEGMGRGEVLKRSRRSSHQAPAG